MNYPTIEDIERIVKSPDFYGTDARVMNRGQLEAALDRPKAAFGGQEQYPDLHQKAAVLMETICKNHTLSDGNKRTAMAAADFMVRLNGCRLVLPAKSVRLLVDTAMDSDDRMSEEIQAWFKIHIARNSVQLRIMLDEILEEEATIDGLLERGEHGKVRDTLDAWMAYDNYPEIEERPGAGPGQSWIRRIRRRGDLGSGAPSARPDPARGRASPPIYKGHGLQESREHEARIRRREASFDPGDLGKLWDAAITFDAFGFADEALEYLDAICGTGDKDEAQRYKTGVLCDAGRYAECAKSGEDLAKRGAGDARAISCTARAYCELGERRRALEVLDRMPESHRPLRLRQASHILHQMGEKDRACKMIDEARRIEPDNALNAAVKSVMMARDGRLKEAVQLCDEVLKRRPDDADVMYNKGEMVKKTGDIRGARECHLQALKIDPWHAEAAAALEAMPKADEAAV